ncbi:AAA domain (dynein-related subfamily) [Roseivivax jejudonensis]|uniref:AAA domain (Dynein-related subfamily) n=1 Tax=Roseivivax jejudonensis TaxID=1529041 RepID=A0A1X6ZHW6_9RHOB|nr:MoxR family ATPase [Roseivivax jejudonensis]SLN52128.1 AAA domain (dynein-related subfamily) [Roseivivax jejudonensis]
MSVNAAEVAPGDALEILGAAWRAQADGDLTASWMLHGRPGVGKTEIVQTLAARHGAVLHDLRLSTIEPQDLRGLPYYDHETRRTLWYPPEDLPHGDAPSVLFLDELTAAAPALQPTVYGLLQERRVGTYRLPDATLVVAAGNTVEDGAIAYEMGTALSDRLVHLVVGADARDWVERYAVGAGIHPSVVAFLRARPDLLETTEAAIRRGETVAATPRAWTRVSRIVAAVTDRRQRHAMIAGTVGVAAAAEYELVADEIAAALDLEALLAAPRRDRAALYPDGLNGLTALGYALAARATPDTIDTTIEVLADIRDLRAPAQRALPLAELVSFGFEVLIRKAFDRGWQAAFARSEVYAAYMAERDAAGLA